MAAFRDEPEDRERLDYWILRNCAVGLVHRTAALEEVVGWFRKERYVIHSFDCAQWHSRADFHGDVAQRLGFPPFYGRNLDAFNDSLGDMHVPQMGGALLVFLRYDAFAAREPQVAWDVLDITTENSRHFLMTGRRLIALVQSDDPRLELAPVGACSVLRYDAGVPGLYSGAR